MSNSLEPLKTVQVLDPITNVKSSEDEEYLIFRGGSRTTYKNFHTNSVSNSSIQWNTPPPSPGVFVDRKLQMKIPVRLTFSGDDMGSLLLQSGLDAFRQAPISSVLQTLSVTINNTNVSINMADVIHPLLRYNNCRDVRMKEYSTTPMMADVYQRYRDGLGANNNPLGAYGDNAYENTRASFPYRVISISNTAAVIEADLVEYLYLSPFSFGDHHPAGFYGVQNMSFNLTFGDLSRMWSHSDDPSAATNFQVGVELLPNPSLLFKYVTPSLVQELPQNVVYPYYSTQRYITTGQQVAADDSVKLSSNNIQLQSIPHRIYVCARRKRGDMTVSSSDVYAEINGITVNWNNQSGLLSSASKEDLYRMSVKNGLDMSWLQYSGGPTNDISGVHVRRATCGSVLCLELGSDIALDADEAPGLLGTYQLQLELNMRNPNLDEAINYELVMIVVSEGSFTVAKNAAYTSIGVITAEDILTAKESPFLDYNSLVRAGYGGDFTTVMKKGWSNFKEYAWPLIKQLAPQLLPLLGLGEGGIIAGSSLAGGAAAGGAIMTRKELLKRLS